MEETFATLADATAEDAWERKVLTTFLDGERLKEIPVSRKKRGVLVDDVRKARL